MRDRKISFRVFTVPEWKKEQEYLRKQHKCGWKFTKVNFGRCYHFEKCEPEDVVYQLDYNPDGIANKDEYVQMFRDCGWEYLQDICGYSYFRKPASEMHGHEEIFCDDTSRIDMMKRIFKGRIIPLLYVFFLIILIILPKMWLQNTFETLESRIMLGIYIALFALYMFVFISFGVQLWRLTNKKTD